MLARKSPKKAVYTVAIQDLPLACPPKNQEVWDMHPRVYLSIEATGKATCPYCSAEYILKK